MVLVDIVLPSQVGLRHLIIPLINEVEGGILVSPCPSVTVLPLVLGVVTRQKLQINGSVELGADESPRPCGTPSWYTPLS